MRLYVLLIPLILCAPQIFAKPQAFHQSRSKKWVPISSKAKLRVGKYLTKNAETILSGKKVSIKILPYSRIKVKKNRTSPIVDLNVGGAHICFKQKSVQLQTGGSLQSKIKGFGCVYTFVFKEHLYLKTIKGAIKSNRMALKTGALYRQNAQGWSPWKSKKKTQVSVRPSVENPAKMLLEWMPMAEKHQLLIKQNGKKLLRADTRGNSIFAKLPTGQLDWAIRAGHQLRTGSINIAPTYLADISQNMLYILGALTFTIFALGFFFVFRRRSKSKISSEDFDLVDPEPSEEQKPEPELLNIQGSLNERIRQRSNELIVLEDGPEKNRDLVFQFCSDKFDPSIESAVRFIERKARQLECEGRVLIITEIETQTDNHFHFVGFLNKQVSLAQILVQDFLQDIDWVPNMGLYHQLRSQNPDLRRCGLNEYSHVIFLDIFGKQNLWDPMLKSLDLNPKDRIRPNINQNPPPTT